MLAPETDAAVTELAEDSDLDPARKLGSDMREERRGEPAAGVVAVGSEAVRRRATRVTMASARGSMRLLLILSSSVSRFVTSLLCSNLASYVLIRICTVTVTCLSGDVEAAPGSQMATTCGWHGIARMVIVALAPGCSLRCA